MKKTPIAMAAAVATAPLADAAADPHTGRGGSYELDPATGQRRLVHRTETPAALAEAPAQQVEQE